MNDPENFVADAQTIRALIRLIGDDPDRPELANTPARVVKAWQTEWGAGYHTETPALTLFDAEPKPYIHDDLHPRYNEMVTVRDINFFSLCEHHLAPFFGVAHVAYVPTARGVVGLSKLARVVNHFSRRLQMQERLCGNIADYLVAHLSPHVGVMLSASHMCMMSRGVTQLNAKTITTALRGNLFDKPDARAEFLNACRG